MNDAYQRLEERFGRLGRLSAGLSMLFWDMETVMPKGGASARAEQVGAIRETIHELLAAEEVGELLQQAESQAEGLDAWQQANLREMQRAYDHQRALPKALVTAMTRATTACQMTWREARPQNDFASLRPKLEEVVRLSREKAAAKATLLGLSPYDALLDEFEPGGRSVEIDEVFAQLAEFLPSLVEQVLDKQRREAAPLMPTGPFAVQSQRALGETMMRALGFDFEHGRLDVSAHPFCGGVPDDVRITTRYSEEDFTRSLMGVIHETGHALYEQGLPARWRYLPVGEARGMAMHESQSLLMEMQACRSQEFLRFAAPQMREAFGGEGPAWEAENLYRLYTRVRRGLIRVDADELTYPLHVILRYRLERALLAGELEVADLPSAWKQAMDELVGIVPDSDTDGCMQDIHWIEGIFGYFPTYTLGAMMGAQLFSAASSADEQIVPAIGRGDFSPLLRWVRAAVHEKASLLPSSATVLEQATGGPLDVALYRRILERRYLHQEH